jgi:hypothetical protein
LTPHQVERRQAAEERLQKQAILDVHGGTLSRNEMSAAQTIRRSERSPAGPDAVCVPGREFCPIPCATGLAGHVEQAILANPTDYGTLLPAVSGFRTDGVA